MMNMTRNRKQKTDLINLIVTSQVKFNCKAGCPTVRFFSHKVFLVESSCFFHAAFFIICRAIDVDYFLK